MVVFGDYISLYIYIKIAIIYISIIIYLFHLFISFLTKETEKISSALTILLAMNFQG